MRYAASFTVHTPSTPSTRVNITPVARREEAIQRGLKRRLEQLSEERERRARAAAAADEDFSAEFLTMARQVFDMIDVDESGYLDKDEIIGTVKADKKVINFLQPAATRISCTSSSRRGSSRRSPCSIRIATARSTLRNGRTRSRTR